MVGAGLVGRNGTGKTTLLKHMAMHAIDGIPRNCQILHVEQEVVGDETTVLQCVLDSDVERKQLLEEEARLSQQVHFLFPLRFFMVVFLTYFFSDWMDSAYITEASVL
jgi:energy-coupling factor transporter ATP-binding protein EcfA2